jgi:hypothetical protein
LVGLGKVAAPITPPFWGALLLFFVAGFSLFGLEEAAARGLAVALGELAFFFLK